MNIFSGDWWDNFYPTHVFPITRVALDDWSKFPSQTVRDPVWFLILSSGLHWCCHRLRCSPADTYNRPHWLSQNFTCPPPPPPPPSTSHSQILRVAEITRLYSEEDGKQHIASMKSKLDDYVTCIILFACTSTSSETSVVFF